MGVLVLSILEILLKNIDHPVFWTLSHWNSPLTITVRQLEYWREQYWPYSRSGHWVHTQTRLLNWVWIKWKCLLSFQAGICHRRTMAWEFGIQDYLESDSDCARRTLTVHSPHKQPSRAFTLYAICSFF